MGYLVTKRSPQVSAGTPANTQDPAIKKANRERLAFMNWWRRVEANRSQTTHPHAGAGIDPTGGAGEICRRANGRCAAAHHGWPRLGLTALHAAGERSAIVARSAQADAARTAPTTDQFSAEVDDLTPRL